MNMSHKVFALMVAVRLALVKRQISGITTDLNDTIKIIPQRLVFGRRV